MVGTQQQVNRGPRICHQIADRIRILRIDNDVVLMGKVFIIRGGATVACPLRGVSIRILWVSVGIQRMGVHFGDRRAAGIRIVLAAESARLRTTA